MSLAAAVPIFKAIGLVAGGGAAAGASLVGGIVAGVGRGIMAQREAREEREASERQFEMTMERDAKEEERAQEAEQRQRDSYAGLGSAMRFWENQDAEADPNAPMQTESVDPQSNFDLALGETDPNTQLGQQYQGFGQALGDDPSQAAQPPQTSQNSATEPFRPKRWRYDRAQGQLVSM